MGLILYDHILFYPYQPINLFCFLWLLHIHTNLHFNWTSHSKLWNTYSTDYECLWQKLLFPSSLHFLPASIPSHFLSCFSFSFPCFHSFCFSSTSIQNNNARELSRLVNLHSILNFKRLHLQANVLLSFKKMSTQ